MKSRNVIQALWPGLWLLGSVVGLFTGGGLWVAPLIIALGLWFYCAGSLHPKRRWSWWGCFAPLALAALTGFGLFASLIHMATVPDYWADANQPGALAIVGGLFYLVPSSLLLWHLFAIRHEFHPTATDTKPDHHTLTPNMAKSGPGH